MSSRSMIVAVSTMRAQMSHTMRSRTCGRRQLWGRCQEGAPSGFNVLLSSAGVCVGGALRLPTPTHSATKLAGIHVPSLTNPRNLGHPSAAYESLTRASVGATQEFM